MKNLFRLCAAVFAVALSTPGIGANARLGEAEDGERSLLLQRSVRDVEGGRAPIMVSKTPTFEKIMDAGNRVGLCSPRTRVTAFETKEDPRISVLKWRRVKILNGPFAGSDGWVAAETVRKISEADIAANGTAALPNADARANGGLLSSEPSLQASISGSSNIGQINAGTSLKVFESKDDPKFPERWYRVKVLDGSLKDREGWLTSGNVSPLSCVPLVLFFGGAADDLTKNVESWYKEVLPQARKEYFDWTKGGTTKARLTIAKHLLSFPDSPIIIVGHSYGGDSSIVEANELEKIRLQLVVTLDPASRLNPHRREKPKNVDRWKNVYVTGIGSTADVVANIGGRWGECPEAENLDANHPVAAEDVAFRTTLTRDWKLIRIDHGQSLAMYLFPTVQEAIKSALKTVPDRTNELGEIQKLSDWTPKPVDP